MIECLSLLSVVHVQCAFPLGMLNQTGRKKEIEITNVRSDVNS